jgi:hypothetical protein
MSWMTTGVIRPDVPLHERLAERDPEDPRRIDGAVDACDDVMVQPRDEPKRRHVLAGVSLGEGLVT